MSATIRLSRPFSLVSVVGTFLPSCVPRREDTPGKLAAHAAFPQQTLLRTTADSPGKPGQRNPPISWRLDVHERVVSRLAFPRPCVDHFARRADHVPADA